MRVLMEHHLSGDVTRIKLANQVSFLNRAALRQALDALPAGSNVLIDASDTVYVDPDILGLVREYRDGIGPARRVTVSTLGFRERYEIEDRIQFVDFSSRELQERMTPGQVFQYLRDGNERFRTGRRLKRDFGRQLVATAQGQHPIAVVLSCIDSRSPAELLFDLGLGDIFSVRVAGNIATDEVLGSMEFACAVAGAKLIVVLGHTRCGAVSAAMKAACDPSTPVAPECGHLVPIMRSIGRVVDEETCRCPADDSSRQIAADGVARRNIARVVEDVRAASPVLEGMIQQGRVGIVGMLYDVSSGVAWVVPGTEAGLPAGALDRPPRVPEMV